MPAFSCRSSNVSSCGNLKRIFPDVNVRELRVFKCWLISSRRMWIFHFLGMSCRCWIVLKLPRGKSCIATPLDSKTLSSKIGIVETNDCAFCKNLSLECVWKIRNVPVELKNMNGILNMKGNRNAAVKSSSQIWQSFKVGTDSTRFKYLLLEPQPCFYSN